MRLMKRNQTAIYYCLYKGKEPLLDEDGNETSEYRVLYERPVKLMCSVSHATGYAQVNMFGKAIKCPSGYKYSLNDISASDAGRTEDTNMDKKRIGQCVKLEMEWQNVSIEDAAAIIQAFNPEYVKICYLDARLGKYRTSEFYTGDKPAQLYNSRKGIWSSVSFNAIERSGKH